MLPFDAWNFNGYFRNWFLKSRRKVEINLVFWCYSQVLRDNCLYIKMPASCLWNCLTSLGPEALDSEFTQVLNAWSLHAHINLVSEIVKKFSRSEILENIVYQVCWDFRTVVSKSYLGILAKHDSAFMIWASSHMKSWFHMKHIVKLALVKVILLV